MILYDSLLAKAILNKKKENVMIFGINFTKRSISNHVKRWK